MYSTTSRSLCFASLCGAVIIILANICSTYIGANQVLQLIHGSKFTYRDHDYPENFVSSKQQPVGMVAEETVHYSVVAPEALEEWATSQVDGGGFFRLGPPKRGFAITMFHELHCMRLMRFALSGQYGDYARGHMHHCLNYLRQEILCASDVTLEPADIMDRDYDTQRMGAIHVCQNWEALYEDAIQNWKEWKEWRAGANITHAYDVAHLERSPISF